MIEIIDMECPSCKEMGLKGYYKPKSYGIKYTRASSNTKVIPHLNPEKFVILSDKCHKCGIDVKEMSK